MSGLVASMSSLRCVLCALLVLCTVAHAQIRIVFHPRSAAAADDRGGRPASLLDLMENFMSGMGGLGMRTHTNLAQTADGNIVALVPLSSLGGGDTERQVTASLHQNGRSLRVHAEVHSTTGSASRTNILVSLAVPASRVRSATFDKRGYARVVLVPATGADLSTLARESEDDAAAADVDEEKNLTIAGKRLEAAAGIEGVGTIGPSTFALWRAALFGALCAIAGLAIVQARRNAAKQTELGPGEREISPLTQVLSQQAANGGVKGDEIVVFDARRKGEPMRKKSDEKVS